MPDEASLEAGMWGCSRVATESGAVTITEPNLYTGPIQAPPPGTTSPVSPDGKYFIALGECGMALPSQQWSNITQLF